MLDYSNKKILIVSQSYKGGGAEKVAGVISEMLHELNYEVHNVIINDGVEYPFKGVLVNLASIVKNSFPVVRRFKKALFLFNYITKNDIQIVIDNRPRNNFIREYVYKIIYGKCQVIYVVHSYNLINYIPSNKFLASILYKKAFKIVCVSQAIEQEIIKKYNFKNTITIYNTVDFANVKTEQNSFKEFGKYIIFFGRFEDRSKNLKLLLNSFLHSEIFNKGYKLLMLGSGPDLEMLKLEIIKLNLENHSIILPFQNNPFNYVRNAKFMVLSSRYEGFPLSIVESLSLGTPVVSVNCKSGPSEIIINEYNGLLVENYNIEQLSIAMNRMVDDDNLYDFCKQNAKQSVIHLSTETIKNKWSKILKNDDTK